MKVIKFLFWDMAPVWFLLLIVLASTTTLFDK